MITTPHTLGVERDSVVIEPRFVGPPGMGNGGYVAARVGGTGPTRVVLRRPVPLDRQLTLAATTGGTALCDGDRLLLEARPTVAPEPLPLTVAAHEIETRPPMARLEDHPFPGCFVCGPLNEAGLALSFRRLESGVGAVFTPPADDPPRVPYEYIVGALDCTSGWSTYVAGEVGILGTIDYAITRPTPVGVRLVAIGEPAGREGRKRFARSSVYTTRGDLVATASATWIDLPPDSTTKTPTTTKGRG